MANKPRVKAPKQRAAPKRDDPAKKRLLMLGVGSLVALAAIVGVVVLLGIGGGEPSPGEVRAKLEEAGCTVRFAPGVANVSNHADFSDPGGTSKKWNTDPPTSGPHYGGTLIYGSYREPVEVGRILHNLEHGAIYILFGNKVPDSTIAQLQSFYDEHRNGTILAPYPKLGNQIALGVWLLPGLPEATGAKGTGVLAKCKKFDEEAFSAYFDAFQFKGPESELFPPTSMQPGGQ